MNRREQLLSYLLATRYLPRMSFQKIKTELGRWGAAVSAHFDATQPPVVGWQIPFVGCGLGFGLGGPRWLHEQYTRLGSPFTIYVKGQRFTFSQDPEFMRCFYTGGLEDVSFFAGLETFPGFAELLPLGPSGPEGANVGLEVLRQFLPAKVTSATGDLDKETTLSLKECLASGQGDLLATLRRTIMRISALVVVGDRLAHDRLFIDAVCDFDDAMVRVVKSLWGRRAIAQGLDARHRAIDRLLPELRQRRQEAHDESEPRDVIEALVAARSKSGEPLTAEVMASELFGFMFGTAANTPAAAAMCLVHILAEPTLLRRIIDEQKASRAAHGELISPAALRAMPLLNACCSETLRLYAPAMHVRMAMKPLSLGKYTMPAGSLIAFSPYLMHHDPSAYTDPEVFDPERFLNGPRLPAKGPPASIFLPFGRGLHTCPGRHLARQEIMLSIARLLRDFAVRLAPCKEPLAITWVTTGIAAPAGLRTLLVQQQSS